MFVVRANRKGRYDRNNEVNRLKIVREWRIEGEKRMSHVYVCTYDRT